MSSSTRPQPQNAHSPARLGAHFTPGHRWDSTSPDGLHSRVHGDVRLGRFLSGSAVEYEDTQGVWEHSVVLHGDVELMKPSDLLDLAQSAAEAAVWLAVFPSEVVNAVCCSGLLAFVAENFGVGEPGMVIDRVMAVFIAHSLGFDLVPLPCLLP